MTCFRKRTCEGTVAHINACIDTARQSSADQAMLRAEFQTLVRMFALRLFVLLHEILVSSGSCHSQVDERKQRAQGNMDSIAQFRDPPSFSAKTRTCGQCMHSICHRCLPCLMQFRLDRLQHEFKPKQARS